MQSPTIIFDHINRMVTSLQPGPALDKRVAEVIAAQQHQVTSSSGTPPKRG
jgi:hypothetical protein